MTIVLHHKNLEWSVYLLRSQWLTTKCVGAVEEMHLLYRHLWPPVRPNHYVYQWQSWKNCHNPRQGPFPEPYEWLTVVAMPWVSVDAPQAIWFSQEQILEISTCGTLKDAILKRNVQSTLRQWMWNIGLSLSDTETCCQEPSPRFQPLFYGNSRLFTPGFKQYGDCLVRG